MNKITVLSDTHLGSTYSNPKILLDFLKTLETDLLILNGDIIDGWALKRSGNFSVTEVKVLKEFQKISKRIRVIYLRGNHDDFLDHFIPMNFGNIEIMTEFYLTLNKRKYLFIHGDLFDKITKELKWISKLGDIGYGILIKLNKLINRVRKFYGMPYYSLSAQIKKGIKKAVNYISDFEVSLVDYANHRNFHGIVCGHIHHPEIKIIDNIDYLNSGDWVESMSYLEYINNKWELKFI